MTQQTNIQRKRELFEVLFKIFDLSKDANGNYLDSEVNSDWITFQDGYNAATADMTKVIEEKDKEIDVMRLKLTVAESDANRLASHNIRMQQQFCQPKQL